MSSAPLPANVDPARTIAEVARENQPIRTALVHPVKPAAIEAISDAVREKLLTPVLVGPKDRIRQAAEGAGIDIGNWQIVDVEHSHAAAEKSAEMCAKGEADALMKGAGHTDEIMSAVVSRHSGLRTERRISHAYIMEVGSYPKPFIVTDAAININPALEEKADILQNAIILWRVVFGLDKKPKCAILAAVETINSKMQATLDAAALCKMSDRGQIADGILDGPLAFDNAISPAAAKEKGIVSPVAGDADILMVPDLEAGNILAKELTFLGHARAAGIVLGARVPIILTSRADSPHTRLLSCAVAAKLARARREGRIK